MDKPQQQQQHPSSCKESSRLPLRRLQSILLSMCAVSLCQHPFVVIHSFVSFGGPLLPTAFLVVSYILLTLVLLGGMPAMFSSACCMSHCCQTAAVAPPSHPGLKCCGCQCCRRCCSRWVCWRLLPGVIGVPHESAAVTRLRPLIIRWGLPLAVLASAIPVPFIRSGLAFAFTIVLQGMLVAYKDALADVGRWDVGTGVVLVFASRWSVGGAEVFVMVWQGSVTLGLAGLVVNGVLQWLDYNKPGPAFPATSSSHHLPAHVGEPKAVDEDSSSAAAPVIATLPSPAPLVAAPTKDAGNRSKSPQVWTARALGFTLGVLFILHLWMLASPVFVMGLARITAHAHLSPSWSVSRAMAPLAPICLIAVTHTLLCCTASVSHLTRRAVVLGTAVAIVVAVVVGMGLAMHVDSEAAAFIGGCVVLAAYLVTWHGLALSLSTLNQPDVVVALQVMVTTTFWLAVLFMTDWLGLTPSPNRFPLWVSTVLLCGGVAATAALLSTNANAKAKTTDGSRPPRRGLRLHLVQLFTLLLVAVLVGWGTRQVGRAEHRRDSTAEVLAAAAARGTFRVRTWNIQRGLRPGSGYLNLWAVASETKDRQTDILGLQESTGASGWLGMLDPVDVISESAGMYAYSGVGTAPRHNTFDGTAILSARPFTNCTSEVLPRDDIWPTFTFTSCVVNIQGTDVTIGSVHPTVTPPSTQTTQLEHIADVVQRTYTHAAIVMGDFNTEPETDEMEAFAASTGMRNVFNPAGVPGFDYPVTREGSGSAIDHVYFRGLDVVSAFVDEEHEEADHLAVEADFRPTVGLHGQ